MSLSRGKYWLLGDRQSASGTHRLVSTIHTPAAFQLVEIDVGNNCAGVRSAALDIGNDGGGV